MSPLESSLPAPTTHQLLALARHELSAQWRTALGWLVPTVALLAATLSVQPAMKEKGSLFEQKLALMPAEMRAAFGLNNTDLGDPVSYLATNATLPLLLGALFAGLLGASLLSREQLAHTVDLLLTRPVSRVVVVAGKLLAAVVLVAAFDVVVAVVALAVYAAVGVEGVDAARLCLIFVGAVLLHETVLAVSLLASVLARRASSSVALALGVVFGSYGAGVVGAISPTLEIVGHLSPFRAVDPSAVASTGHLPLAAAGLPVVTVAALLVALALYRRKDLGP